MPVFEFPLNDCLGHTLERPPTGLRSLAFFAPHRGYAVGGQPGGQVREFKEMVLALHRAGIEVILDVVFNHTAEGNGAANTRLQRFGEPRLLHAGKRRRQIPELFGLRKHAQRQPPDRPRDDLHCLRYWSQLPRRRIPLRPGVDPQPQPRGRTGANPPVLEAIAEDPLLATARSSPRRGRRRRLSGGHIRQPSLAEWNGHYRDDLRRFWRGDSNMIGRLATRLAGSSDLYAQSGRKPYHSINFITPTTALR